MNTKRFLWMAISLIALFELAVGCTNTANLPTGKDAEWTVVIIGDSSMWEHGVAIASQIQKDLGVKVVLEDFALPALRARFAKCSTREILQYEIGSASGCGGRSRLVL
jgi:hypothetical protein